MPIFGGFSTNSFTGNLVTNALGSVANAVFPPSQFGGLGSTLANLVGQNLTTQDNTDRRVSLRPRPAAASTVYGSGLMMPLRAAGGLIWPYTPSIQYAPEVSYETMQTVHTNQDFYVYSKTPSVTLTVSGDFTVQNQEEGQYALAVIHFLRTVTKMNFGDTDSLAGTPPPILLFNAYGPYVFKDVPVIVKGFSVEFPDTVDYVQVKVKGVDTATRTIAGTPGTPGTPASTITAEALPDLTAPPSDEAAARAREQNLSMSTRGMGTILAGNNPVQVNDRTIPGIAGTPGTPSRTVTNSTPITYTVWLPSMFKVSATLVTQHTPKALRSRFNLPKYRNGAKNQSDFI